MSEETMNYTDAYNRLQVLIEEMENGNISIDVLSEKIKEASKLIGLCTSKLKTIETDVNELIEQLEKRKEENYI